MRTAPVYLALLLPVSLGALAIDAFLISTLNSLGRLPDWMRWIGLPIVILPALALGFAVYLPAGRWASNGSKRGGLRSHLKRSVLLYLAALGSGALLITKSAHESGHWSFGLFFFLPFFTAIGGILADAVGGARSDTPVRTRD